MVVCQKCTHKFDDSLILCPVCGTPVHVRLQLIGALGTRIFGETSSVGRDLLRSICGEEDARFAESTGQFVLELKEKTWTVLPGTGRNPTFLNGKRLAEPAVLQSNDILSIGQYKARVTVFIEG